MAKRRRKHQHTPGRYESAADDSDRCHEVLTIGDRHDEPQWATSLLLLLRYAATEAGERNLDQLVELLSQAQEELIAVTSNRLVRRQ